MEKYQQPEFVEAVKNCLSKPPHRTQNPYSAAATLGDKHFSDYGSFLRKIQAERDANPAPQNYTLSEGLRAELFTKHKQRKHAVIYLADKVLGLPIEDGAIKSAAAATFDFYSTSDITPKKPVKRTNDIAQQLLLIEDSKNAKPEEMADVISLGYQRYQTTKEAHIKVRLYLGAALIQAHLRFAEMKKAESLQAKQAFTERLRNKLGKSEAAFQSEKQRLMADYRQEMAAYLNMGCPKQCDIIKLRQFYLATLPKLDGYIQHKLVSHTIESQSEKSKKTSKKVPHAKEARVILGGDSETFFQRFEKKKDEDKARIVQSAIHALSMLNAFLRKAPSECIAANKQSLNKEIEKLQILCGAVTEVE